MTSVVVVVVVALAGDDEGGGGGVEACQIEQQDRAAPSKEGLELT